MADTPDAVSRFAEQLRTYVESRNTDVFLYSGGIGDQTTVFGRRLLGRTERKDNLTLILTTHGGDPDAAFRLAKIVQRLYKRVRVIIAGPCKSAGTLIAVGADELIFGACGELGPLDIQLRKPDEMLPVSSGLDTLEAFQAIGDQAFAYFEAFMLRIIVQSGGAISTKTACEVATNLVAGIAEPIAAQLDPYRLGEVKRRMAIAEAYGQRLDRGNLKPGALDELVSGYPTHGFVIDREEAESLFQLAVDADEFEHLLVTSAGHAALTPHDPPLVVDFLQILSSGNARPHQEGNGADDDRSDSPAHQYVGEDGDNDRTRDAPAEAAAAPSGERVPAGAPADGDAQQATEN